MTTATAHLPALGRVALTRAEPERVLLVPDRGGWSLVSTGGDVLLQRLGAGARRACLEYARSMGILTILS